MPISEEKQSMCRATVGKLTFGNIKKQSKVIHDCTGMAVANRTSNTSSVMVGRKLCLKQNVVSTKVFIHDPNRPGRGWCESRGSFQGTFRRNYRGAGATSRKKPIKGTRSNVTRSDGARSDEKKIQEVKKEW